MNQPRVGVVCTSNRDAFSGRHTDSVDAYVVASNGRATWFEDGAEKVIKGEGRGMLVAIADGMGDAPGASAASSGSVVHALARFWTEAGFPAAPTGALMDFLLSAHTSMYWKSRDRGVRMEASVGVVWVLGDRLHWVEVGSSRVYLYRDGELRRVGQDWEAGTKQRFLRGSRGMGDDTAIHFEVGRNAGTEKLRAGDEVLVVTDGFWRAVDEASAAQLLGHVSDPQTVAVTLMERAIARGAKDAITCAVVDLRDVAQGRQRLDPTDAPPHPLRRLVTEP